MKNFLRLTALAICAIFMVSNASAQVITAERASEIANQFFANGKQKSAAFRSTSATLTQSVDSHAITGESNDAPTFHILTGADGKGFVIVSGEETENPIIGYSFDGTIDTNNLPDGFVGYMSDIDAQVRALREYNAANPQKAAARSAMQKTNYNATSMGNIQVLLETAKWGQGSPFNRLCFTDATHTTNAATGCVPTAFAIVMRYHKWPEEGIGRLVDFQLSTSELIYITDRTYDWDNMPLVYDGNWSDYQINEVAKVMRDLGHTYMVEYGQNNTGVSVPGSSGKLETYFNYNNISGVSQAQVGSIDDWKARIRESLNNNCPIPYKSHNNASGDANHMFVLDGYTDNDYFHFNWGWSGGGNGWYQLSLMNPLGSDYSWGASSDHLAIFNLTPKKTPRTVTASVSPAGAGTVTVNGNANTADVTEGTAATLEATANSGYTFSHWSKNGTQVSTEKTYKAVVAAEDNDYVANFLTVGNSRVNVSVTYNSNYGSVTYNSNAVQGTGITPYENSEVTLIATPLDGYVFNGWTVTKGTNTTNYAGTELTFVATEDMSVEARFSLAVSDYTISTSNITKSDYLQGSSSYCSTWTTADGIILSATKGSEKAYALSASNPLLYARATTESSTETAVNEITFTLTAPDGYILLSYDIFCYCNGSYTIDATPEGGNTITINRADDHTISASGINAKSARFVLSSSNGNAAIRFDSFTVRLQSEGGGSTQTPTTYTINATAGEGGSVTINGEAVSQKNVNENSTVTVVATPQTGYSFVNWTSGTSTIVSTNATYSFTATGNTSLLANFAQATYTVNVEATEGGSAYIGTKGTTQATAAYNGNVTITAEANDGYEFVKWTDGEGNLFSTNASVPVSVTTDARYIAVFRSTTQQGATELAGKYFRLKVKNTSNYMNIANTNNNTSSTSGVTVVAKNESSDTQIFLFEQSGDGYKLKANSGNYIKCHAWNANANTTSANDATVLTFETTGNELEYLIKWNNTNMNEGVERDDYFKAENGYVYCDAASNAASTWVLEEVIPSLTVTFAGATWNNEASGWWVSVVTNTTPTVTVRTTDGTPKIGYSTFNGVRHPYLLDGNSFTISVPANCKITGYTLGYQAHNLVSKSVTYTNGKESTGIVTITQSNEQNTLTVTGLDNNEISFSVEDQSTQAGFIIKSLEITYIEDTNIVTHTVSVTAGENGTATASAETVVEGDNVTLTATANTDYKFVGWYDGETKVSEANPYTFAVTSDISYEARFEELFPDGAYKVYWQADGRGYLAYHGTDYPNEAKLAGVTYSGCQNLHYGINDADLVWYLITASDGKRYLFEVATGKFLGVDTSVQANGTGNKLSTTEAWPIAIEENTKHTGHYIITTEINSTNSLLCSGCGTPKEQHPVRWLTVNDNNQADGGAPLQLIPVNDVTVADNVMSAVRTVIEPRTFKFQAEVENWRNDNPNTHLGTITIGGTPMKLTPEHLTASELTMPLNAGTTLAFTRKYRGFEFQGFYIGATELGQNPTLTAENVAAINENTPLVAKFTATNDVTLFYDDDEFSYRIPAIAKTGTNRLVAISDYRHNLDDIGRDNHGTGKMRIDLVMRTSDDNGATWSDIKTIAAGDDNQVGSWLRAFGDAAVAAYGNNILVMCAAGDVLYGSGTTDKPNRMARIYSTDNGTNWAKEEMTTKMYSTATSLFPDGGSAFFGSGKLAVDPNFNGTGNARIYGAVLIKMNGKTDNNFVVYSDDFGATWKVLGGDNVNPVAYADEPKVEILPNGQILLSARRQGGRRFNVFTYGNEANDKANGVGTWNVEDANTKVDGCSNGGNNGTNGEIICLDAKRPNGLATKIMLQSQPKGGAGHYDRYNVTIWYKEVSANETYTAAEIASGWTQGLEVSPADVKSAYSAMCLQENGKIAFFFEEAPCYGDDHTKGYSMVYVPLTIEEITNNNFLNPNADVEYVPVEFNIELTDTEGNIYRETLDYVPNNAAAVATYLTTTYPFITLGENGAIADNTYTNTVTLPFKVSNANTTVWHNIYWPANTRENDYPVYLSASSKDDTYVPKVTDSYAYGNHPTYNTLDGNEKISWAIYNVNNGFEFIFKNKVTDKYIQVTSVADGNAQNVQYVENIEDATAFTIFNKPAGNDYYTPAQYALAAKVGETTGYLCSTSATGYNYATHYFNNSNNGYGHQGAWIEFVEAPDYQAIIDQLIADINNFGAGEGKYTANDAISSIDKDALATMPINSLNTQKENVQTVKDSYREITLTVPEVNDVVPGSVSIAGEPVNNKFVPGNTEIELLATANAGYVFKNWTRTTPQATAAARTGVARATEVVSTDNPYRVTVSDALSLTANFEQTAMAAMTAILTDEEGNTYRHQFDELPGDAAAIKAALEAAYPFITLGKNGAIADNTYTNTVELPFRVSNNETTVWHNIYWPANGTSAGEFYPIYLMANSNEATYVAKITEKQQYSYSQYNTLEYVEELGWAVYSVDNTLTFKFKNRLTNKFMAVDGIVSSGSANNVIYTDEANATVFTLTKNPGTNNNWKGDWAITSVYNSTTGYICNTSAGHPNATNYTGNNHPGAWVKFVEAAEESSINDLRIALNLFGEGALHVITDEVQGIITALESPNNIKLNTLDQYGAVLDDAMTNWKTLTLTVNDAMGSVTINDEARKTKKAPSGFEFTVVATPANGYRFTHWSNGTTTVSTDASYTFNMPDAATGLTANFEEVSAAYPEVTGNTNANNYLTSVTTEGGRTNVNYSANTHPGEKVVTIGTVQIGRGESFSMNLIAYSLGAGSTSAVREDMRYCHASLFTDFDGDRTFGAAAQTWGVQSPSGTNPYAGGNSNVYGNYDLVMNITANITVPVDAPLGESHVRMIYTNAWKDWPTNGTTTLDKGIVYDIIVEVVEDVENVTITVGVATENTGTVTINGEGVDSKQVAKDSEVTVVATPASGYHFVNWTDAGGYEVSTDASYTFTANENTSLVANFEADVVYHTITVSTYYDNNGGTVKVGEEDATSVNVAEGESVRMLATVADGYEFMGWLKDGVIVKNAIDGGLDFEVQGPDYTLYEIKASAEYVAVFSKITETTGLEDGKAYRICGVQGNGRARCIYRDGNTLKWKYDYDNNDVNTIFVAQKNGNAMNLISAVGYHGWKASNILGNDEQYNPYAAIKVTYGTRDELRTLYIESGTSSGLFQTNTDGAFSFQNSRGGGLTMIATDEATTDFLFEEVDTYAFQVSAADGSNAKLGTVNLPFATTVPAEVTVYGVNDSNEDYVYVAPLELTDNVLPANTPVLIEAAASGKYGFKPAPASANVYETGFAGTLEAEAIPGTTNAYILSYKGVGTPIKMYKLSSTDRTINANKAYYIDSTGRASTLQFVFGETTDIDDVEREDTEDTIYDLKGRKLSEITEPGFYIVNGKKIFVK